MSDLTVRYDNVYLYCERKQKASLEWRLWLDTRETAYIIIDYDPGEASELAIVPLRTWTFKNNDACFNFEGLPILVYEDIVWESPDGEDRYSKQFYAITIEDLPSDFVDKVVKVS
jgi:hypothetical protein